jgi:hypothetical protein
VRKVFLIVVLVLTEAVLSGSSQPTKNAVFYLRFNKYDAFNSSTKLSVTKKITDARGQEHAVKLVFEPEAPNLWSCSVYVNPHYDERLKRRNASRTFIALNGEQTRSNLVFLKFNRNGALEFITDAAGERVSRGTARVGVSFLLQPAAKQSSRQAFYLSFGTIGALKNSSVQSDDKKSAVLFYAHDGVLSKQ